MNLYLIENDKTVDLIISSNYYTPEQDIIICFNYLCYLRLREESGDHRFVFVEELLTKKDYHDLHAATDSFAQNWYKPDGIDQTLFNGVSYGEIVETMFSRKYMVSILLKYGTIIYKAVEKWSAVDSLYYDFSNSENYFFIYADDRGEFFNKQLLVQAVAKQLKLKVNYLETHELIPSAHTANVHSITNGKSIKHKLIYLIIRVVSCLNNLIYLNQKRKGQIYFFIYFNTRGLLKYASPILIVSSFVRDKLLNLKAIFSGISYLDFSQVNYVLDFSEKNFLEQTRKKFSNNSYKFYFNGIDYTLFYKKIIEDISTRVIPRLMEYIGKVRKGIRNNHIKSIIVMEELDELQKALISASRLEGSKTVFVDHGIQGHNHAQRVFDRNGSDIVICSGEFFRGYYKNQRVKDRNCVTLGNPSMDCYPVEKRKKITNIKKVLFLTFEDNFYARLDRFAYQEKYYEEIFSIFDELVSMGIQIYFKPHPGERREYIEYLITFFNVNKNNIHYIDNKSFTSIIYDMDLLISNVSACYYESLAAGVPVIFLEPCFISDALLPPLNSSNPEEVIRVETGKEILKIIKENYRNPEKLNMFVDRFMSHHSYKYMGKLDGNAAERILDFAIHMLSCAHPEMNFQKMGADWFQI